MDMKFSSIANPGDIANERLVMKALADMDVGQYVLLAAVPSDGGPLSGDVNAYWFPDQDVKAGDFVVLYTKQGGARKQKELSGGHTAWFFYWGKAAAIWGPEERKQPVLVESADWDVKDLDPSKVRREAGSR